MHLLTFFSLLGAMLSLLLALRLVLLPTENRAAALTFAGYLICAALFVVDDAFYREDWFAVFPWMYAVANPFILASGPTLFLYTRAVTEPGFVWRPRMLLHFVVPVLWVAGDVPVYLASSAEKLRMARADFDWAARPSGAWIATVPITGYLLAYGCSAWWRLWRRRARIAEEQEEGRPHPLRGIGLFTTLVVVIGAVSGVLDFTPWVKEGNSITAFAAVLGIFALLWSVTQPTKLIVVPRASVPRAELSETAGLPMGALPPAEGPAPRPEPGAASAAAAAVEPAVAIAAANASVAGDLSASEASSVLSAAELALLSGRLRRLLEEDRIHLDPDLSLHVLAERSKTTRHKMSVVLKQGFGGSFYQVISGYRVREAARTLRSKQGAVRTIADIAFASGFNSLSAFNVAFRAYFSQTPSVFRDDASEKTTVSLSRK